MRTAPIGELTKSVRNWNPSQSPDKAFLYIDLSAVDNVAKVISAATTVIGEEAPSRARQLVAAGDVLVSTVRPNLNAVAVVPPKLDGSTASTGFTVLRPADNLDGRYLFQWVRSQAFIADMVRNATGASYPAVSDRIVKGSMIPAPGLEQQRRTAAILDRADDMRTKRRQVLAHVDILAQSVFNAMFGTMDRSSRWPVAALCELADIRLGKMLDAKKQSGDHARPYLRNANVQWFRFALDHLLTMDFDERDRATFALAPGDVLVCEGGQPGRSAIWRGELRDCYFQKALHRVRLGDELKPDYFVRAMWALVHEGGLKDFVTSATIAHLTGEKLRTLPIPVPPAELQQEFAYRVTAIDRQRNALQTAQKADGELFASLQSRAFRGDL